MSPHWPDGDDDPHRLDRTVARGARRRLRSVHRRRAGAPVAAHAAIAALIRPLTRHFARTRMRIILNFGRKPTLSTGRPPYGDAVTSIDVQQGLTSAEVADRVARGLAQRRPRRADPNRRRDRQGERLHPLQLPRRVAARRHPDRRAAERRARSAGSSSRTRSSASSRSSARRETLDRLAVVNAPHARVVRDGEVVEPADERSRARRRARDRTRGSGRRRRRRRRQRLARSRRVAAHRRIRDRAEAAGLVDHVGQLRVGGHWPLSGHEGRTRGLRRSRWPRKRAASRSCDPSCALASTPSSSTRRTAMVPTAILLAGQPAAGDRQRVRTRCARRSAASSRWCPKASCLLTSVAFAVGVVRLGKVNMLVQELPAVEGLARVDVLCLDKTGTLTEGAIAVQSVETIGEPARRRVAGRARRARRRRSLAERHGARAARGVPLARRAGSRRVRSRSRPCASGARSHFVEHGSWFLGAPDVLLPIAHAAEADLDAACQRPGRGAGPRSDDASCCWRARRSRSTATGRRPISPRRRSCCSRTRSAPTPPTRSPTSPSRA